MTVDAILLLATDLLADNHARLMFFTASVIALLSD
jgi:hypothetical protein